MTKKTDLLWPRKPVLAAIATLVAFSLPNISLAQQNRVSSFNLYGVPGLIDLPTADLAPDGTLSTTISKMGNNNRSTLTFQITPRLTGSFRYAAIQNFSNPASVNLRYYDRSFDVRYQLMREGKYRPAVAIGLQDFIGTGLYGAEYIVASKQLVPGLRVTGGLGWGRLGSANSLGSTGNRPASLLGQGGIPTYDRWFRGPYSAFGGVSYAPSSRLAFKVEYSTDAYTRESTEGTFNRKSPWNFGVDYRLRNGGQLSAYYAYGSEVGIQMTFHTDLKSSPRPGGTDQAPVPVLVRDSAAIADLGWTQDNTTENSTRKALRGALEKERLVYEGLELTAKRAVLRVRNPNYRSVPQAIGRAARVMSRIVPASVEEFVIVPVGNGMAMSAVKMRRSDIENLENAPATEMLARTSIVEGFRLAPRAEKDLYPRFLWSLAPYVTISAFDPSSPVRMDGGLRLQAKYQLTPNIVVSGALTKKLFGDLTEIRRTTPSTLPKVRTDANKYSAQGDPAIQHLTVTGYGRPGKNLYSRVTVGYLETMYAGVSGEVLWKPVESRLALGLELNYVRQRAFDQLFGLQSYGVLTGHASAYYDLGGGFHGQVDVGRYLAGDVGATVTLDREFSNGWRVGAYATFTNVDFDDFGEGSFDKGIRVTMPMSWTSGKQTRNKSEIVIQSLTRDGGARLNVNGRLYNQVRDYHRPEMEKTWGRVWR